MRSFGTTMIAPPQTRAPDPRLSCAPGHRADGEPAGPRALGTLPEQTAGGPVAPPQPVCRAAALPAARPENRQPPRKVPSSALYPCTPPPPKPATSPAA